MADDLDNLPARLEHLPGAGLPGVPGLRGVPASAAAHPMAADAEYEGLRPHEMDEIVLRVIEKIEQRVIDELERRGRRFTPGVF